MPAFVGERHKTNWIAQLIDGGENIIKEYGLWVGFERAIPAFDLTKISGRKLVDVLPFTCNSYCSGKYEIVFSGKLH